MLPSSHQVLIEPQQPTQGGALLAAAFSDFMAASSRLERSYRDLQGEVAQLKQHLSERNQALTASHSENKVMRERLQRILETVPCGVLVLSEHGSIRLINAEAARLLGRDAQGRPVVDEFFGAAPSFDLEALYNLGLEMGDEQELFAEGPDGRLWIAVRQVRLPRSAGSSDEAHEVVLTLQDISLRKSAEQEREAARDAVAQAQVSAMLAHEIRNPLASMELFAGLLADDPDQGVEWMSHLRAGIRSLSGTVNNVLSLHQGGTLVCEAIDVREEASLAVHFMQPLATQASIVLSLLPGAGADGSELPRTLGNRGAFHQILMNLCGNALRHSRVGSAVDVLIHPPAEQGRSSWCISVRDSGSGIDPGHLPQIFDLGFSGSGTTSGLGLAVSARLAQRMGGLITVESLPGYGSTFTLELPWA